MPFLFVEPKHSGLTPQGQHQSAVRAPLREMPDIGKFLLAFASTLSMGHCPLPKSQMRAPLPAPIARPSG